MRNNSYKLPSDPYMYTMTCTPISTYTINKCGGIFVWFFMVSIVLSQSGKLVPKVTSQNSHISSALQPWISAWALGSPIPSVFTFVLRVWLPHRQVPAGLVQRFHGQQRWRWGSTSTKVHRRVKLLWLCPLIFNLQITDAKQGKWKNTAVASS